MDLRRLREETRPEHEATEAQMPLMRDDLSPSLYRAVLERMLPVLLAWEASAAAHAPADLQPLVASRVRSPLLRADLANLGADSSSSAVAPSLPFREAVEGLLQRSPNDGARTRASFLGALYVIEGSTLGGQYIARHVDEKFAGVDALPAPVTGYFRGYGEATGSRWREVQAELSAVPEALGGTVIEAARVTFRAFGKALEGVSAAGPVAGDVPSERPLAAAR